MDTVDSFDLGLRRPADDQPADSVSAPTEDDPGLAILNRVLTQPGTQELLIETLAVTSPSTSILAAEIVQGLYEALAIDGDSYQLELEDCQRAPRALKRLHELAGRAYLIQDRALRLAREFETRIQVAETAKLAKLAAGEDIEDES
ncbi:MAG TPA: hypothetical protein VLF67_02200 [Candidatus Saccharimonas sp.]|nr:hypothetical protein [Candidatus Saccharimonas sp.]